MKARIKLTLPNGSSRYGAQMGRPAEMPDDYSGQKLRLTRLPFVDGCYDRWGAYWGAPANVWCAWGESETEHVRIFVRGHDREEAKAKVRSIVISHFMDDIDKMPSFYR